MKRGKLEIIRDILTIVKENRNAIKTTPLLRKSNISSARFKEYYVELVQKGFIVERSVNGAKLVSISEKGARFLEKYQTIIAFIDEFEL